MMNTANELDFLRLALRNPEKFIFNEVILEKRAAFQFLRSKFFAAPLFVFDKATAKSAFELGTQWKDVMARLMPDVRLPYPQMIIAAPNKELGATESDNEYRIDLLWQTNDISIGVQPINGMNTEEIILMPFSYRI